jgi:endoglucanase
MRLRRPASVLAALLALAVTAAGCGGDPAPAPDAADGAAPPSSAAVDSPSPTVKDARGDRRREARQERRERREARAMADLAEQAEQARADQEAERQAERDAARERRRAASRNPLAGRRWGVYKGPQDMAWDPYVRATGATKRTLAVIALAPKAKWMGHWIPDGEIYSRTRDYIANAQAGDPETLVQMTMFRMVPWEQETCRRLPTKAEQASYKRWTDNFARAIGRTPTAIVLQPDGPFALCAPGGSKLPSSLIAYSARVLSALPRTSVYIEAGAADWPAAGQGGVDRAADVLMPAGIRYARGFALNGTHYSSTADEVRRGAALVEELASRGVRGKHFVVNTSGNGQGFEFGTYQGPDPLNAWTCRSKNDPRTCVALGIPPTADVAAARWGLPDDVRKLARAHADAYLWFGRPWLYRQNEPFQLKRALAVVRSSPYV